MSRLLFCLLVAASTARCAHAQADLYEERRWLMGTELRLVLVGAGDEAAAIARLCFDQVAAIEESLSTWIEDSPLSRLNARAGTRVRISEDLARYLERCAEDSRRTEGAFDPSVGTWLRAGRIDRDLPIGMHRLRIERTADGVFATAPHAAFAVDSGGNGKGIAVDRVVEELRAHGVRSALIDFGHSSWYGLGSPPDGEAWVVEVEGPDGGPTIEVSLVDRALSTSASMQVDVDAEGREHERAHIYDPRTATPITARRVAVVTSPSAEDAEVLSTALVVEGEAGLRFVPVYPGAWARVLGAAESAAEP